MGGSSSGVAAMVQCAAWLEQNFGIETLTIGRESFAPKDSCTLEACGRHLFYIIKLDGGWVNLSAQLMDAPSNSLESLLMVVDGPEGWHNVCTVVRLLEREEVKSLERPIELGGGSGPNGFVIA